MRLYGLLAEFQEEGPLVEAARKARAAGYRRFDAYAPHPVEGLPEAMGLGRDGLPALVLAGGVLGAVGGYALQYYTAVVDYPVVVGGRPAHAWPAFIPVTFELTILCAALVAVLGMFALNGLPMPYHPLFHSKRFEHATRDRFFLCIEAEDPLFDAGKTRRFLEEAGAVHVEEIEP